MGDFETVKEAASLKDYAEQHLTRGRDRGTFVCPLCDSGTGKNKTAAFSIMPNGQKWHCFACDKTGDIYDLAGALNGTDSKAEQLRIVADWAGVAVEHKKPQGFQATMNARAAQARGAEKPAEAREEEKGIDTAETLYAAGRERHRRYVAECAERLRKGYAQELDADEKEAYKSVINYLTERGITLEEAMEIGLGYDPNPKHGWKDEAGAWHNTPRLVIPWAGSDYYHIDRAIDSRAVSIKYDKPPSEPNPERGVMLEDCVGEQPLYNPSAFEQPYMIVVEGALDAIALQLCGYNAVALGGTAVNDFVTEATERKYAGVVVDMLDADGDEKQRKGRGAGADLVRMLGDAGVACLARAEYGVGEGETYEGHKDAGEWLAADRDNLTAMLEVMSGLAIEKGKNAKEAEYRAALKHLNVKDPATVALDVLELRGVYEPVPTGITALDYALGGGVNLGETTFFGAISSYGKTTMAVQIADYMASRGYPVLFVTVEQSAKEIVAKSLSRLVYTENVGGYNVISPSEITSLATRRAWSDSANAALAKATREYNQMIAPNMKIVEGNEQPTVRDIRAVATVMKEHDGRAPIIFIDYLQLLAPLSERYDSDKRNADANVSELRKLARDLTTHVWCISSLNRSSYSGTISLDSFKESGGIEYGADNLLGLQPHHMEEQLAEVADSKMKRTAEKIMRESKAKSERECELVVLKQRNGALPNEPLPLTFKPQSAYFAEPRRASHEAKARRRV